MSANRKRPRNATDGTAASPTKNAFDFLMAQPQKQHAARSSGSRCGSSLTINRRKSSIHFVPCPAGCGQHIAAHNVNLHLDLCFDRQNSEQQTKNHRLSSHALEPKTETANKVEIKDKDGTVENKAAEIFKSPQQYTEINDTSFVEKSAAGTPTTAASLKNENQSLSPNLEAVVSPSQSQQSTQKSTTDQPATDSTMLPTSRKDQPFSPPKSETLVSPSQPSGSKSTERVKSLPEQQKQQDQPYHNLNATIPTKTEETPTENGNFSTDFDTPDAVANATEEAPADVIGEQYIERTTHLLSETTLSKNQAGMQGGSSMKNKPHVASACTSLGVSLRLERVIETPVSRVAECRLEVPSTVPPNSPYVTVISHTKHSPDKKAQSTTQSGGLVSAEAACPEAVNDNTATPLSKKRKMVDNPKSSDEVSPGGGISTMDTEKQSPTQRGKPEDAEPAKPCQLFAHMMAQSKKVFRSKQEAECWFWYTEEGVSIQPTGFDTRMPVWTATIKLRDGPCVHLATNLPPATTKRRYVQRHSRLSVPVLKSILQKSIRRRKPLPSVRVALELADKSLGDFLRRLPVIILEDSALHPDIGILVWLMMAQSKDYEPPSVSMEQVFRVVFEIASCQWQDHLESGEEKDLVPFSAVTTELEKVDKADRITGPNRTRADLLVCVWATMARASYGGMHGDVRMLHNFAALWFNRLQHQAIPRDSISVPSSLLQNSCSWSEIPNLLHQRARGQSTSSSGLFLDLVHSGIDFLRFNDISVEGVDLHCSAVIDQLLRDEELVQLSTDLLILSNESNFPSSSDEEQRERLSRVWKSCMWNYCSGINHRRPLLKFSRDNDGTGGTKKYEHLWKSLAAAKALEFQQKYVRDRLLAPS
eukprot:scaffold10326_cov164-Amphora_coffeaeformis.AAC.4